MSKEKIVETKSSMGISRSDIEAWIGKGPTHGMQELRELRDELSQGIMDATSKAINNHPECASFFGLRGRVEIACSANGETMDTLCKLGFGPGVDMDYVDGKDNKRACKCECCEEKEETGKLPEEDKLDKLISCLMTLAELKRMIENENEEKNDDED